MVVTITIIKPSREESRLVFDKPGEVLLGRSAECHCRLESDPLISRRHAAISIDSIDPPLVRVKDLGSTNGISINGNTFGGKGFTGPGDFVDLGDGDLVKIGKTLLRIGIAEAAVGSVAAAVPSGPATTPAGGGDGIFAPAPAGAPAATAEWREDEPAEAFPKIDGYRVLRRLGSGSLGSVYLAESEGRGALVAIKVMIPGVAFSPRMLDFFTREIEVVKSLDHPNLVKLHKSGVMAENSLYLVVEYVGGGNLAARLARSPASRLPAHEARSFAVQIAEGMAYAHRHGFIHRDLRPANILLAAGGEGKPPAVKISDLGLAKAIEDAGMSELTKSFSGGGTLAYMPPEQLSEYRDSGPAADVFGVGAIFYEMLCGVSPYHFVAGRSRSKTVASGDIVPVENRLPDLPETLIVIINRSLSPDPEDRYPDCRALLEALRDAIIS